MTRIHNRIIYTVLHHAKCTFFLIYLRLIQIFDVLISIRVVVFRDLNIFMFKLNSTKRVVRDISLLFVFETKNVRISTQHDLLGIDGLLLSTHRKTTSSPFSTVAAGVNTTTMTFALYYG